MSAGSAAAIDNPKFFEYRAGGFINQLSDFSFGWFKTFNNKEMTAYQESLIHAVMFAENGQTVRWFQDRASGYAVPVMTWPRSDGYCRRIHIQAIAHNVEKTMTATACYNDSSSRWTWYSDKYQSNEIYFI